MADERRLREQETRDQSTRSAIEASESDYVPPSVLPDITPEPGFRFKWVATHVLGQYDPTNAARNARDGWTPVEAKDHPELASCKNNKGLIEIGGLLLCKCPESQVLRRDKYYAQQAFNQQQAVQAQFMRGSDPRMPLFSESKVDVVKGVRR